MARASDEIFNPRTGQRMMFLETGEETSGQSLRIDTYNPPTGVPEPEHVHPFQESGFQVISGSLRFRVSGEERSVSAGESITIPANTPHSFPLVTVVQARPKDGPHFRDSLRLGARWQARRKGAAVTVTVGRERILLRRRSPVDRGALGSPGSALRSAEACGQAARL